MTENVGNAEIDETETFETLVSFLLPFCHSSSSSS